MGGTTDLDRLSHHCVVAAALAMLLAPLGGAVADDRTPMANGPSGGRISTNGAISPDPDSST